eukprot:jgi/Tetstr1/464166/TSEL_008971.t1
MEDAQIATFEMLIRRLEEVEASVGRAERLLRDQPAAQDVREIMLVSVSDLVHHPIRPHHRLYKLCERMEDALYEAVDLAESGKDIVRRCVDRLRELGANRITFLMLCQMSNLTDDLDAVLDVAEQRRLVPIDDSLAFALHAEDLVSTQHQSDPDEKARLLERVEAAIDRGRPHWGAMGFVPGRPWTIGHY